MAASRISFSGEARAPRMLERDCGSLFIDHWVSSSVACAMTCWRSAGATVVFNGAGGRTETGAEAGVGGGLVAAAISAGGLGTGEGLLKKIITAGIPGLVKFLQIAAIGLQVGVTGHTLVMQMEKGAGADGPFVITGIRIETRSDRCAGCFKPVDVQVANVDIIGQDNDIGR